MVALMKPQPGEHVHDPAAGTIGFLEAADRFIKEHSDQLFDLSADPGESRNLVSVEAQRAAGLRLTLRALSGSPSTLRAAPDRAGEERLRALGYVR